MNGYKAIDIRLLAIILLVFFSCGTNIVFLELIIRQTPGAGNVINFAHVVVVTVDGLIFATRSGGRRLPATPLTKYIIVVINSFVVSVANSYTNVFNIPMPLIMIFRSGSLIASLMLGSVLLNRTYSPSKYVSVIIITIGIIICTLASVSDRSNTQSIETNSALDWTVGISLMLLSLLTSANMGILQEKLYHKYGKHPREALFYTHFLQIPGFLLLWPNIVKHVVIFNTSEPFHMISVIYLPLLWLYLLMNCFTQYICIRCIYLLSTECNSLSLTLVVTLRKFLSLIFSIFYFQNPFTTSHWFGTVLVFFGTLLFVDIPLRFYKLKLN